MVQSSVRTLQCTLLKEAGHSVCSLYVNGLAGPFRAEVRAERERTTGDLGFLMTRSGDRVTVTGSISQKKSIQFTQ